MGLLYLELIGLLALLWVFCLIGSYGFVDYCDLVLILADDFIV